MKGFAQFISVERGLMLFMISMSATFLIVQSMKWVQALYLSLTVFCIWSAVDAINNVCDMDLDKLSDPARSQFTKRLGRFALCIIFGFVSLSLALGAVTMVPYVLLFVGVGLFFGVLYSVPPFRLRKTAYKPAVNFTVGAIPVMIVAAFFNEFSVNVVALILLIGVTTAVNSLWEDLADYASDQGSCSRTVPVIFGFRRGLVITIVLGYVLIPLMVLVGLFFELGWVYYGSLAGLVAFISIRLIQRRNTLTVAPRIDEKKLHKVGELLAKDFVITALVFTFSLMASSLLKMSQAFF